MVRLLIGDGAPQFTWVTLELALCWVHEGRHYKKLFPYMPQHQKLLDVFLGDFWDFYRELLAYRRQPTPEERQRLEKRFDALFTIKTGYGALDERIALTLAKKANLLMVLAHPEIPLHNNPVLQLKEGCGSGYASGRSASDRGWPTGPRRGIPLCRWLGPRGNWG